MATTMPAADVLVTTATGQVGSAVATTLVDAGVPLRVLVRPGGEARLPEPVRRAARVFVGALTDEDAVRAAADGATGAFLSLPPDGRTGDLPTFWLDCARAVASASPSLQHAVLLSSQGTADGGEGLLGTFFEIERILAEGIPNTRALRAGGFMENLLPSVPALAEGVLPFPMRGDAPVGMVATADLGRLAGSLLADPSWTGHRSFGVYGPEDLTMEQAAAILSDVLGRRIQHVQTPLESMYDELLEAGMSEDAARLSTKLLGDMTARAGEVIDPRTAEGTTGTDFARFARDVILPAVQATR